jgi:CubicO group peptidase (beta-lactamase class C family)
VFSENLSNEILKPINLGRNMQSPLSKGWIVLTDNKGRKYYGRGGGTTGGGSALLIYPDEKLVVAATMNLTEKNGEIPVMVFASKFLSKPEESKPIEKE